MSAGFCNLKSNRYKWQLSTLEHTHMWLWPQRGKRIAENELKQRAMEQREHSRTAHQSVKKHQEKRTVPDMRKKESCKKTVGLLDRLQIPHKTRAYFQNVFIAHMITFLIESRCSEVRSERIQNICDDILASMFVVFIACVNKPFQTLQYKAARSECRAQSSSRQRWLCLLGPVRRRSRKTPVISIDDGNPTGAQFKWTTMISEWLSV